MVMISRDPPVQSIVSPQVLTKAHIWGGGTFHIVRHGDDVWQ